ncbi:MAG: class I SAM-dependent methyltransferase [Candidatus Pacebacteria bacterium]|jgi:SAM-dependent methyltransferase|nr:class I SAM-dependent methyltransferase [Candidatus Paceibacterota bacterium]
MGKFDPKIYERDVYEEPIYSSWLKYTNQRDLLELFLTENFHKWCKTNPISILELGCGSGSAAQRIFSILEKNKISYSYLGVDPYQDQLNRWPQALVEKSNITLMQGTVESFIPKQKFDLILIIHALYYVDDLPETLIKVNSLGTTKLIVHHGEFGINEVQEKFRSYVKSGPNIISTYHDVKRVLDSVNIPYELNVVDTKVDIRPCHDLKNKDGTNLIKFFLEHSELPEETLTQVSAFLKNKGDIIKQDDGYFFI